MYLTLRKCCSISVVTLVFILIYLIFFNSNRLKNKLYWYNRNRLTSSENIDYQNTKPIFDSMMKKYLRADITDIDIVPGQNDIMDDYDKALEITKNILPSLPSLYLVKNYASFHENTNCSSYPNIYDLEFNNIYWQQLSTSKETFYLYNAYYDNRNGSELVKVLSVVDSSDPTAKIYCQFWYDEQKKPTIVQSLRFDHIWSKFTHLRYSDPYFIVCPMPKSKDNLVPDSVSLVENECDYSTNNLRVINNRPDEDHPKKQFAVCVKGLDFLHSDLSVNMMEWIEQISALGADKIFMYKLQAHPNITKVLNYYEQQGKVVVTPLTLPSSQPNLPNLQHLYLKNRINHKRQNELIPYHDCFYQNMYKYDFIALLDTDEIILPNRADEMTWADIMAPYLNKTRIYDAYNVRNLYFYDNLNATFDSVNNIPRYLNMFKRVERMKNFHPPFYGTKSFYSTRSVTELHNHLPVACFSGNCKTFTIPSERAQLNHYRSDCVRNIDCRIPTNDTAIDTVLWKYKDDIIPRVINTMNELNFFKHQLVTSAHHNSVIP